jgi:hypothetical protein
VAFQLSLHDIELCLLLLICLKQKTHHEQVNIYQSVVAHEQERTISEWDRNHHHREEREGKHS